MPAFCEANLVASSVGDTMARDWGYWTGHFTGEMGVIFWLRFMSVERGFGGFKCWLAGFEIKRVVNGK